MKIGLIYPHQLSFNNQVLKNCNHIILLEEPLFFSQYKFHKQKIMLHRSSMKFFEEQLLEKKYQVSYLEFYELKTPAILQGILKKAKAKELHIANVTDDWLSKKINRVLSSEIKIIWHESPLFLTSEESVQTYQPKRADFYFFSDFYIFQRKRFKILMEKDRPVGGKWSFDQDNRKKVPSDLPIPKLTLENNSKYAKEAYEYVNQHFGNNYGDNAPLLYAHSDELALKNYQVFLDERFKLFGDYEDAILDNENVLFHSLLTPSLNIGLITPQNVLKLALSKSDISINSREGFVRQVLGWREFMRLIYQKIGARQRTTNFLQNKRAIPKAFYEGNTGVVPVDQVIKKVLKTGYCHHIERLMILGNFMLLCDYDPDQVYQWFMELFIDSYDWIMVPNVYGMSQYADSGLMTTKPYISGSSYVLKMSNYKKGPWCKIWDALYWRFIDRHYQLISKNPRMSVMAKMRDKLSLSGVLQEHLRTAEGFLSGI